MTAFGWIVLVIAYLITLIMSFIASVLFASAAMSLARHARFRLARGPHRDGCPCWPCREYEDHVRAALLIAASAPGPGPSDGEPLSLRDRRVLRGITLASRYVPVLRDGDTWEAGL